MRSFYSALILSSCAALAIISRAEASDTLRPAGLVVHEWGTFTSVAGVSGRAVQWLPADGSTDLPCFVHRASMEGKAWYGARVRMETPVLYFYATDDATVDVRIGFHQGVITEWYPGATVNPAEIKASTLESSALRGSIEWRDVKVRPQAAETFPMERDWNHYYSARATQAAPVHVGSEQEKFLFYRGIANFAPPLSAVVQSNGSIVVRAAPGQRIGDIMLFESRDGQTAHQVKRNQPVQVALQEFLPRGWSTRGAGDDLEALLIAHGLYEAEARAMLETWRDAWFEEGTRLFYVVSESFVDSVLPLRIVPKPATIERVFVGRLELITRDTVEKVTEALAAKDVAALRRYHRFLTPILERIHTGARVALRDENTKFASAVAVPKTSTCRKSGN